MKFSYTISAFALLGLAACGGEREVEEPVAAEERLGEREAIAPVVGEGEVEREGALVGEAREREGVIGVEGREREGVVAAEGLEREE